MKNKSIAQLRELFQTEDITEAELAELRDDHRKGVQQLIRAYDRQQEEQQLKIETFNEMKQFDEQYRQTKKTLIAGIDEAGRGPLAGPVVSAAVILPDHFECIGLTDSKLLSEQARNEFYDYIIEHASDYYVSIVNNDIIDQINILEATKQSMLESILKLKFSPQVTLIDAVNIQTEVTNTISITKGDQKSLSIAAASILAKVARDRLMIELDERYPMYDFKHNKGYGSAKHLAALKKYGPSPYHRMSFSPVQNALKIRNQDG